MENILVIGSGTMGIDIAQVFAKAEMNVVVQDISSDAISGGEARLKSALNRLAEKGKISAEESSAILSRIIFTTEKTHAANSELVIEAAVENLEVKQRIFAELDEICPPNTIFASNTSSISITAIASATKRSDRFIGMHFFNPATVMKLVEVIRGNNTNDDTTEKVKKLITKIGKEPVEVNEAPGFVVNKILIPMINEAVCLLETGVSSVEEIDTAMKLGANHPMGPLALGDLVGLDICLAIMDVLLAETGDSKYRASTLLRKMVRGGKLGRKSGEGFYKY